MYTSRTAGLALGCYGIGLLWLGACATRPATVDATAGTTTPATTTMRATTAAQVTPAFATDQLPGNLTSTPDGRRMLSPHQFYNPERILAEIGADGRVLHYPARGEGQLPGGLGAVRHFDGVAHEFFGRAAVVADAMAAQHYAGQRLQQAFTTAR